MFYNKDPLTGHIVSKRTEISISWQLGSVIVFTKMIISIVQDDTFEIFHGVRKAVMKLNKPVRCLINQYIKLFKLIIVMPATNAVSDGVF